MARPYISFQIEELEELFAKNQDNAAILNSLLEELINNRKTDRASRLCRRVEGHITEVVRRPPGGINQGDLFANRSIGSSKGSAQGPPSRNQGKPNPPQAGDRSTPPDDRHYPLHFFRISAPGVRGKPDPFVLPLNNDVVLKIPEGASRPARFVATLDALIREMRREGAGHKRYELENGRCVDHDGSQPIYAFAFNDEAAIFEDAEIEIEVEGRRAKGQVVSISQGTLLIAITGEFGPAIPRCVLRIDNTALLAVLKERLGQASSGNIKIDFALAESVINVEHRNSTVDAIIPTNTPLNIGQQKALHHLLQSSVAYLWGPPGTGKTETLSALVQSAFDAEKRVLICSNTNQAVDQVLLKLCNRLNIMHRAMIEGRILRLGQPINKDLREKFAAYVTSEGILGRLSSDLKRRQAEVEDEIARIDVQAATTNRVLGIFAEIDRGAAVLVKLRQRTDKAASEGKAAVVARDRANQQRDAYQEDLRRRQVSGLIKRTFMRSEEKIRADLSRAQAEAERRDEIAVQWKDAFDTARAQRDAQGAEVTRLAATVREHDRALLEANRAAFEVRRDPLVSELQNIARKLADLEAEILRGARVIGTTVAKSYLRAKDIGRFDLVIVDEASMVLLPALYFVAGLATERVIISGDFRQLPPIIPSRQQAIHDEIGKDAFAAAGIDDKPNPRCAVLDLQYRMVEPICRLIAGEMYRGQLKTASNRRSPDGLRPPPPVDQALTIVDTSQLWPFEGRNAFGSRFNLLHALLVRNLALLLRENEFISGNSVLGICTPYAAQAKLMHGLLLDHGLDSLVSTGTVHRYQGDEKRMMIFDVPESIGASRRIGLFTQGVPPDHIGARVINVAVSRARENLVIFANLTYLEDRLPSTALLRHILYGMQQNGVVVDGRDILALRPIDVDLKRLLGIAEIEFDTERLGLFNARAFAQACPTDMWRAEKSIIIFSGFITPERVSQYGELIRAKRATGVAVRCVTRPPRFNGSMPREATRAALDALEAAGAVVDCRRDIHEKVVLIDSRVVWSGSLNPLSHTWRTDEVMNRLESPNYAETVAAFLSKRPWIAPNAAAASVANAENPRCPLCGGRTYYADGHHGPYFSCEEEDACGWRQGARKPARPTSVAGSNHPAQGPPCPKCGKQTRLRQGHYGPFYSCLGYPTTCDGTVNIGAVAKHKRRTGRSSKPSST